MAAGIGVYDHFSAGLALVVGVGAVVYANIIVICINCHKVVTGCR